MAVRDVTVAARVPIDLRTDLEAIVAREKTRDPDTTLTTILRRALRTFADRELADRQAGRDLFRPGPGAARAGDNGTAKAAAADVAPRRGAQRWQALKVIAEHGTDGATADEVIATLERRAHYQGAPQPAVNGIARRVTDLLQAGAIQPRTLPAGGNATSVVTRPTRHGSDATVYIATDKGRRWLREVDPT